MLPLPRVNLNHSLSLLRVAHMSKPTGSPFDCSYLLRLVNLRVPVSPRAMIVLNLEVVQSVDPRALSVASAFGIAPYINCPLPS